MLEQQEMSEEDRSALFWQNIRQKRQIYVLADVVPFYMSWLCSALLMIDRKVGKTAAVLLCGAMCYLEYNARILYGQTELQSYFDKFNSLFPPSWTLGESLALVRSLISVALMLLVFVLDATVDRLVEGQDPCSTLNKTLDLQKAMLETVTRVKDQARRIKDEKERDQYIEKEVLMLQP
jgi:hypothetical protein